jgi:putative ABC transport system substrate-binding protein
VQWLNKLQQVAPNVSRVAVLTEQADPANRPTAHQVWKIIHDAAPPPPHVEEIDVGAQDLAAKIRKFARQGNNDAGLIVAAGTLAGTVRKQIIQIASDRSLPAIYPNRLYVEEGGLMSYGAYLPDLYRLAGQQANTMMSSIILQQPLPPRVINADQTKDPTAKFELAINLDTAAALSTAIGGTIGPTILSKATLAANSAALVIGPSQ